MRANPQLATIGERVTTPASVQEEPLSVAAIAAADGPAGKGMAFLRGLTEEHWRKIAARMPGGDSARRLLESGAATEIPIRVEFAGRKTAIVASLVLDRRAVEQAIGENFQEEMGRPLRDALLTQARHNWVEYVGELLGPWLATQLKFFAYSIASLGGSDNLLVMLEGSPDDRREELLSVPTVLHGLQCLARHGEHALRKRARLMLQSGPPKRGRSQTKFSKRVDVSTACTVMELEARLAAGVESCRVRRRRGGFASDSAHIEEELIEEGYSVIEAGAIVRGRSPQDAALHLHAFHQSSAIGLADYAVQRRTRTAVTRGKRLLAAGTAPWS